LVGPELARTPRTEFLKSLYLASPGKIFDALGAQHAKTIMAIGHNPGMEELAGKLAGKPQSEAENQRCEKLREKFSTCALAVLDFDASAWSAIEPRTGALTDFLRPKDLSG
jgi:phosphohistidine phosphatase